MKKSTRLSGLGLFCACLLLGSVPALAAPHIKLDFSKGCPPATQDLDSQGKPRDCVVNGVNQPDAACRHAGDTVQWTTSGSTTFSVDFGTKSPMQDSACGTTAQHSQSCKLKSDLHKGDEFSYTINSSVCAAKEPRIIIY